jgi:SOS-response transcriptional repressor LexA
MPHALSDRQKEVLEFIRGYIARNECSPRLEEIAAEFEIKPPTVHKILEALQSKGFLYFGRDSISGFFIRLIERAGTAERVIEVAISGSVDRYGEVYDFPEKIGHFATVLSGADPTEVFALYLRADIPQVNMVNQDLLILDIGKKPQPGDICIAPIGNRFFLVRIGSKTYDEITPSLLMAQQYPIPEKLSNPSIQQDLNWYPISYDEQNHDYLMGIAKEEKWGLKAISPDLVVATALRLVRTLAF